jgi:hypothetical protein
MPTKSDFNAEEWSTVVEAPVLAGLRVVAAARGGTIRESLAVGRVYAEARKNQGGSDLLDEIVASPPAVDPQRVQAGGDIARVSTERLQEALRLVSEKGSPETAEEYKRFVLAVAQAAAEAHKEGGFAGIGGRRVSEEEQRALDELRRVMDAQ